MATEPRTRFTYRDLEAFGEDNLRREIIDGELFVTASPSRRHQRTVVVLVVNLHAYSQEHGGEVLPAPFDVHFTESDVVEPDVIFVQSDRLDSVEERFVRGAPDIVVEVSSPSTRRLELVRKLDLYQRFGVPEYWFVDLDADRVEVYRSRGGVNGPPALLGRGDTLTSSRMPGLSISVQDVLGSPETE
jgi:Uma2 family endonuclease